MPTEHTPESYAEAVQEWAEPALSALLASLRVALQTPKAEVVVLVFAPYQKHDASSVLSTTGDLHRLKDLRDHLNITIAHLEETDGASAPPGSLLQ